jgi:ArsR family transcriptional regulator, arsenate/arsenite/antimonite-responsive transcriptional repressor
MTEKETIEVFKALSVNSRVQIIKLIKDKKRCVNAITNKLGISQSAVSQHLKVLKECGLVESDQYGSIVHYQLNKNKISEFKNAISKITNVDFIE